MREVCKLGREVLDEAHRACRVGVTTDEIDRVVHEACVERNCYPSPLGYGHFPKSCCTSVNEVVCHGIPDSTELKDGDIINVDVSVFHKGMHGDLNETYCVGNVDARGRELVAATYDCLWRAIAMCKPGVLYRDVGDVITKEAKLHKLSVVRTYCRCCRKGVTFLIRFISSRRSRRGRAVSLLADHSALCQQQGHGTDADWTHFHNRAYDQRGGLEGASLAVDVLFFLVSLAFRK
jgi:hypothetical protein